MSFLLVANGKHCHDFMELQALYIIDFRNGNYLGLFESMWLAGLVEYDFEKGLEWE